MVGAAFSEGSGGFERVPGAVGIPPGLMYFNRKAFFSLDPRLKISQKAFTRPKKLECSSAGSKIEGSPTHACNIPLDSSI